MTDVAIEPARCRRCRTQLAPSLLSCPSCRSLVHADRLAALAERAQRDEQAGRRADAVADWREALALLPTDAGQHATILARIDELTREPREAGPAAVPSHGRAMKGGAALGGLALILWKLKVAIPFLLTKGKLVIATLPKMTGMFLGIILSLGVYWMAWGWWFAVGIIASIYIHEIGHVVAMRMHGVPSSAPMFVPGLGAYVRMHRMPKDEREDARIGLAGPVGGLVAALAAVALWLATGNPFFAAVAKFGAWINIFNLTPVWQLDGARAFRAFSRTDRGIAIAVFLVGWLISRDGMLLLLPVVAAFRLGAPDPERRDGASLALFGFLVLSLAAVLTLPVNGHTP